MFVARRNLQKLDWRRYFDDLSNRPEAKRAEIEIASLHLGD